jgi:outer membrane protein insertion porin family
MLATAGWARDRRDSFLFPRSGTLQRAFLEATVPVGDLRYIKASYQHQTWFPIGKDFALMLNGEIGWAQAYSGKSVPFYKNFFAGGIGSVRGFEQSSLGPKVQQTDGDEDAIGGDRKLVGNVEFYFPIPGLGMDKSFRASVFLDTGYVWGEDEDGKEQKLSLSDLRYSTGLGFSWSSPMGPLKFSLGFPLNAKDGDKTQNFQFQLGSTF